MDISPNTEDIAFRQDVRTFIRDNLPPDIADRARRMFHIPPEDMKRWQNILYAKGWVAPGWPKEYGGTGWNAIRRHIFDEECRMADAPLSIMGGHGIPLVGPVIYTFGSPEQKAQYLPRILQSQDFWAQGFSEPGAGSDLASLTTRAEKSGNGYIINGHKIWTSLAHHSNMIFCLARTDPDAKPQRGISFFVFPIDTPGVTIGPILSIDRGHSLNETFLENVRVPADALIGEEGMGWTYAKFLLGHERISISEVAKSKRRLQIVKDIAAVMPDGLGGTLLTDPVFADKITGVEIELLALEQMALRLAWDIDQGASGNEARNALGGSILKLRGSEIIQSLTALMIEATGEAGLAYDSLGDGSQYGPPLPDVAQGQMEQFLFLRSATIYGGSTETQKNILSKMIFSGI